MPSNSNAVSSIETPCMPIQAKQLVVLIIVMNK